MSTPCRSYATIFLLLGIFVTHATTGVGADLFVASDGDDNAPGTIDKPLATLAGAKAQVRRIKKSAQEPITVHLRGGTYYLSSPIVFEPEDSGTVEAPVTYTAYREEQVVVSAGRRIAPEWTPHRDGILKADVPRHKFDQLFVDGRRQTLARWPNRTLDERGVDVGYTQGIDEPTKPIQEFTYDPGQFSPRRWARPDGAIIHIFQAKHWGNMQWRIRDIDYDANRMMLGEGGWQLGTLWYAERAVYVAPHCRFYIENVMEELDSPGEWYYDARAQQLYYMPVAGEDPAKTTVETAGRLKQLFVFQGRSAAGKPTDSVRHVHLRGLVLRHTARVFLEPYETRLRGDWAITRLGAVKFDGVENCSIVDCHFDAVGGNGVFISNYARRIGVVGCRFHETGESAVCVVGNDDAVRNLGNHKIRYANLNGIDTTPGPRSPNYPAQCQIADNLMHELGVFGKQTAGVYISAAEKIVVRHNTIFHTPRAAICINDGCWGGHRIQSNDLFQTVRETGDHGPFNSWGRDRFWQSYHRDGLDCDMSRSKEFSKLDNRTPTVIENNRLVHETSRHSWGIDLDDGSSNYIVRGNLCLGCGVKLREGYFRTVENNIFITPFAPAKQCCFEGSNDIIRRNIVVHLRGNWGWVDFRDLPVEMDHNLYHNFVGKRPMFRCRSTQMGEGFKASMTMDQWQAQGLEEHSVFADPQFTAPEKGDFSLRPTSPALKLGFKNLPMDQFGTRKATFQAIIKQVPRKYRLIEGELQ